MVVHLAAGGDVEPTARMGRPDVNTMFAASGSLRTFSSL